MIMIVPCCGQSERFNGIKKQFIKLPNGLPLPVFSQAGITNVDQTIYTFLYNDYLNNYGHSQWLWGGDICLLHEQTESQVDTIRNTIRKFALQKHAIYIKDCDNYFQAQADSNIVTVQNIFTEKFKLHNKSYTLFNSSGLITNISERKKISDHINVGGYGFINGDFFIRYSHGRKFISEVIINAMKHNVRFHINTCANYIDYGEQDDFDKFIKTYHNGGGI